MRSFSSGYWTTEDRFSNSNLIMMKGFQNNAKTAFFESLFYVITINKSAAEPKFRRGR